MKKLLFGLILSINLFAGDLLITKNQSFTQSDKPTMLKANFTLSEQSKNIENIEKNFTKNSEIIKKQKICKGGTYSINPRYRYDKNEKAFLGYEGSILYECEFEDIIKYDEITKAIIQPNQQISLGGIRWILGEKQIKNIEQNLELEALRFATTYSLFLSKNIGRRCESSKIELFSTTNPHEHSTMLLRAESSMPAPTNELQNITKSANFEFVCK